MILSQVPYWDSLTWSPQQWSRIAGVPDEEHEWSGNVAVGGYRDFFRRYTTRENMDGNREEVVIVEFEKSVCHSITVWYSHTMFSVPSGWFYVRDGAILTHQLEWALPYAIASEGLLDFHRGYWRVRGPEIFWKPVSDRGVKRQAQDLMEIYNHRGIPYTINDGIPEVIE